MTQDSPHLTRLAALDGLRGVAALAVVFTHATLYLGLLGPTLGGTGVLVFFVLSGYLIARVCLRLPPEVSGYLAFVRRRAIRLGPAVTVVALAVPLMLVLAGVPWQEAVWSGLQALTQSTGIFAVIGPAAHTTLQPTWSLTTEWTFYLLFPLAFLTARHHGATVRRIEQGCVVMALLLWLVAVPLGISAFFYLPLANVGVMLAGAALGLAHHQGWVGPEILQNGPAPQAGLVLILALVALPGGLGIAYELIIVPAVVLAAVAIIHGVALSRGVAKALSPRWLSGVGMRAYSLYLWHVPCLWLAWTVAPAPTWLALVLGLALTGVLTAASFLILERPVLPSARKGDAAVSAPIGGP